ncbi:unnamed protein product [Scytosiphon promiscuus]
MDSKIILKIARGVRDVAKARGNRNPSSEIPAATNRFSNSNNPSKGRSRAMGHVGVAVRRDDTSRLVPTDDSIFGERDEQNNDDNKDDDTEDACRPSPDKTRGPRPCGSRPANTFLPSPSPPLAGTTPDQADDDTTIDLTEDSPEPAGSTPASLSDCDGSSATREGRPCPPTVGRHSLASWLVPVPSPEVGKGKKRQRQQRQQPLREADGSQGPYSSGGSGSKGRTWGTFLQESGENSRPDGTHGREGDCSLSAWLEPRPPPASRKIRTSQKGVARADSAAAGHGSSGFLGYEDETSGNENDSGKWMSDRLEGLDPSGAARAKDSWTDRERRNLTCTDIALGAKRKSRGGRSRGWKTKAGGSKVFVETGGGVVATGRAAYRKSKRGRGGGGGVRKKRRG